MTRWTAMLRVGLAMSGMTGAWTEMTRAGSVSTREGKTYAGKVEFKAGNQVRIVPANGAVAMLPLPDFVQVIMTDPPPPVQPADRDPHLPPPWRQSDVGRVKEAGSARADAGVFTVRGAGWGAWGAADSFHFVYQVTTGDLDLKARLGDRPAEENPFVAGLAVREGLDAAGAQASVMMFPGGGLRMSCRPVDGSAEPVPPVGTKPYAWVRLVRAGDRFSGFGSPDGGTWTLVGTVNVRMSATANAGMTCATTLNHTILGTTFDHVTASTRPQGPVEGLGLVDGSLVAGRVKRLDEKGLLYTDPSGAEHSMPASAVSFVFTRPLPEDVRQALTKGKPGVALASGDAIAGDVQGIRDGHVTVTSLLLGRQTPALSKVVIVMLRPANTNRACLVYTRDGSIYRCPRVVVGEGVLTAEGASAGTVSVKAEDLVEVNLGQERP